MLIRTYSAANNQVFLDFLAQLRGYFLTRDDTPVFQSVILAGVYDIKNLKLKLRPESEHKYNSPWNIAEAFNVDMSLSYSGISEMLLEYEIDHHTGMDIKEVAECIYEYTCGYPYLVSAICKIIDERFSSFGLSNITEGSWTEAGVSEAVKIILKEPATLFDSMMKQVDMYGELRDMLYAILFMGQRFSYNADNNAISLGAMFGFLKEVDNCVAIANRIFETRLYNFFLSKEELTSITVDIKDAVTPQGFTAGRIIDQLQGHEAFAVPVGSGAVFIDGFKAPGKRPLCIITGIQGDFHDGPCGKYKRSGGLRQPPALDVIVGRHSGHRRKHPVQMEFGITHGPGQHIQIKFVIGQVCFNKVHGLCHYM